MKTFFLSLSVGRREKGVKDEVMVKEEREKAWKMSGGGEEREMG